MVLAINKWISSVNEVYFNWSPIVFRAYYCFTNVDHTLDWNDRKWFSVRLIEKRKKEKGIEQNEKWVWWIILTIQSYKYTRIGLVEMSQVKRLSWLNFHLWALLVVIAQKEYTKLLLVKRLGKSRHIYGFTTQLLIYYIFSDPTFNSIA